MQNVAMEEHIGYKSGDAVQRTWRRRPGPELMGKEGEILPGKNPEGLKDVDDDAGDDDALVHPGAADTGQRIAVMEDDHGVRPVRTLRPGAGSGKSAFDATGPAGKG